MSDATLTFSSDENNLVCHVDVIIQDLENGEYKLTTVHIDELYAAVCGLKLEYDEERKRAKE